MRTFLCSLVWVAIIISVASPISVNAQQSPGFTDPPMASPFMLACSLSVGANPAR
jgi:hypothetical protein